MYIHLSKNVPPETLHGLWLKFLTISLFLVPVFAHANTHSVDLESDQVQYLEILDTEQNGLDLDSNFTIEAWVKLESYPAQGTWSTIVGKTRGGGTPDRAYGLYIENKNGTDYLILEVHGNNTVEGSVAHTLPYSVPVGVWKHIAVTYDLTQGEARFYIDASLVGTTTGGAVGSVQNGGQDFRVGRLSVDDPYSFDGLLDEVRVWSTLRTPEEIAEHYQKELGGTEMGGLVAYWDFNQNTSDRTQNVNNLTGVPNVMYSEDVPFGIEEEKTLEELLGELREYVKGEVKVKVLRELYLTHLTMFEKLYGKVSEHVSVIQLELLKKRVEHDVKKKFLKQTVGEEIVKKIDEIIELLKDS